MSIVPTQTDITVIDTPSLLLTLLGNLSVTCLPVEPPLLYLDLEGINLSRHGTISILTLYVLPEKKTYLIDIHNLGATAFSTTTTSTSASLKTILESPTIPKVIFDVRNDSDALFAHYKISLDGIHDVQLMELATRGGSKNFVAGLKRCVEEASSISATAKAQWKRIKESGTQLFNPEEGGQRAVFDERPIRPEIMQYCAADVAVLPELYRAYNAQLSVPGRMFWQAQVREATKGRVKTSRSPAYDPHAQSKARGPWGDSEDIERAIDDWNEEIMHNALYGDDDVDPLQDFLESQEDDDEDWDNYGDTARDCIGWEEDMISRGSPF